MNLWIHFDRKAFWETRQSGSHGAGSRKSIGQSDLAFTSFGPPLLLLDGRAFYTKHRGRHMNITCEQIYRTSTETDRNHVYMQTHETTLSSAVFFWLNGERLGPGQQDGDTKPKHVKILNFKINLVSDLVSGQSLHVDMILMIYILMNFRKKKIIKAIK